MILRNIEEYKKETIDPGHDDYVVSYLDYYTLYILRHERRRHHMEMAYKLGTGR